MHFCSMQHAFTLSLPTQHMDGSLIPSSKKKKNHSFHCNKWMQIIVYHKKKKKVYANNLEQIYYY